MASNYWAKLWIEMLDDPKVARLDDHLWRRWVELILLAKERNERGGFLPSLQDMAWRFRVSDDDMQIDLGSLAHIGLIRLVDGSWQIVNFDKRQEAMENAERQRRHREGQRRDQYYGRDTSESRDCHDTVTVRNVEADTETEENTETEPEHTASPSGTRESALGENERTPIVSAPTIPGESTIKAVQAVPIARFQEPDPALGAVWDEFMVDIRGQVGQTIYDAWYTGLSPGPIEDGCVYIGVPRNTTRDYLQGKPQPTIKRTLGSILGKPVDVMFQVIGEAGY